MSRDDDLCVTINGQTYWRADDGYGGAQARVYRAVMQAVPPPADVVLRYARRGEAATALEREIAALRILNAAELAGSGYACPDIPAVQPDHPHTSDLVRARLATARATRSMRRIIMLLDIGYDQAGDFVIVQELAPPQFEPFLIRSLADEERVITLLCELATALQLVHQNGMALKDFNPAGDKLDRLRFAPAGDQAGFKIIDWNVTGTRDDTDPTLAEAQQRDLVYFSHYFSWFLADNPRSGYRPPDQDATGMAPMLSAGSRRLAQSWLKQCAAGTCTHDKIVRELRWWQTALRWVLLCQSDRTKLFEQPLTTASPEQRHDLEQLLPAVGLVGAQAPALPAATPARPKLPERLHSDIPEVLARKHVLSEAIMRELDGYTRRTDDADVRYVAAIYRVIGTWINDHGGYTFGTRHSVGGLLRSFAHAIYTEDWATAKKNLDELARQIPTDISCKPLTAMLSSARDAVETKKALESIPEITYTEVRDDRIIWLEDWVKEQQNIEVSS
jgi:hypothetical protein